MSATIARLILSTLLMVAMPALYVAFMFVSMNWMRRGLSPFKLCILADCLCGVILVTAWILIWRSEVRWTYHRASLTVLAFFAEMIPAFALAAAVEAAVGYSDGELGVIFGAIAWA